MTDNTHVRAHERPNKGTRRIAAVGPMVTIVRNRADSRADNLAWRIKCQPDLPWPFKPEDMSPLQWWRALPPDVLHDPEQVLLLGTLERIDVLHAGEDLKAALAGDGAAAIDVAFSLMPIEEITLTVDIGMTALCRCALARNAASALVMAQVIGLTNFDHGLSIELAMSWYRHGLRYASDPRKFREAETVLLKAFHELDRSGRR